MNKKTYLIIIWTITLFVIIFSSYHYVKQFKNEYGDFRTQIKEFFSDYDDEDDEDDDDFEWNEDSSSDSIKGQKNINTSLDEFSNIKLEGNIMELTIKEGSDYHLECAFNKEKLKPAFEISNGLLKINQNVKGHLHGNNHCKLILTLPAQTKLSSTDINVNVGSIMLKNFDCENIDVEINVGGISVKNMDFKTLDTETNVGEILIKTRNGISEYSLDVNTDVGEVSIDDNSYKHSYKRSVPGSKEINATTNVGTISVE